MSEPYNSAKAIMNLYKRKQQNHSATVTNDKLHINTGVHFEGVVFHKGHINKGGQYVTPTKENTWKGDRKKKDGKLRAVKIELMSLNQKRDGECSGRTKIRLWLHKS